MYKIKVIYSTGNSFDSYDEEEILEIEWESLDMAKRNLLHIQSHYNMYNKISSYLKPNDPKLNPYRDCIWFNIDSYAHTMKFELDNGKLFQMLLPWIGYFANLYSAEIIFDNNLIINNYLFIYLNRKIRIILEKITFLKCIKINIYSFIITTSKFLFHIFQTHLKFSLRRFVLFDKTPLSF